MLWDVSLPLPPLITVAPLLAYCSCAQMYWLYCYKCRTYNHVILYKGFGFPGLRNFSGADGCRFAVPRSDILENIGVVTQEEYEHIELQCEDSMIL